MIIQPSTAAYAIASLCLIAPAANVHAQNISMPAEDTASAPDGSSAIVVSGVRQAYRGNFAVTEIPQSIDLIDSETLEENNLVRLNDALDLNASVARQNTLGGLWDSFAIRGFAGDENIPTGYLVNGFNGGRGFGGGTRHSGDRADRSPERPRGGPAWSRRTRWDSQSCDQTGADRRHLWNCQCAIR